MGAKKTISTTRKVKPEHRQTGTYHHQRTRVHHESQTHVIRKEPGQLGEDERAELVRQGIGTLVSPDREHLPSIHKLPSVGDGIVDANPLVDVPAENSQDQVQGVNTRNLRNEIRKKIWNEIRKKTRNEPRIEE